MGNLSRSQNMYIRTTFSRLVERLREDDDQYSTDPGF